MYHILMKSNIQGQKRRFFVKKYILLIGAALIILLIGTAFAQKKSVYKVNLSYGNVKVSHNEGQRWAKVEPDMELAEMDTVKTGSDSYCDILMPGRGNFRLVEDTMVTMNKLRKQLEQIKIKKGRALFNITQKLKKDETFNVESEVAVAAVRGTQFVMETDGDKLKCSVIEGTVAIKRNVTIPVDDPDGELAKLIQVNATANQEIVMTMDENKELENLLSQAKNNMAELKSILNDANAKDKKKVMMMKNADRLLKDLEQSDDHGQNNDGEDNGDDASSIINKTKSHTK